tara:strand:- start:1139 stop:1627 length:489 start_codon:yes stop_codon:yes gene_type:complete
MLTQDQLTKIKLQKIQSHLNYLGLLEDLESLNLKSNKSIKYNKLNPKQHFLFKRVLHGLKMYSQEEVSNMHWDKKRRITKVWKRGQMVINQWKQYLTYKESNKIFSIFASSKLAKEIVNDPFTYMPDYINKLSFKSFGIEYEHLIIKFIANGLLPKNFFDLK